MVRAASSYSMSPVAVKQHTDVGLASNEMQQRSVGSGLLRWLTIQRRTQHLPAWCVLVLQSLNMSVKLHSLLAYPMEWQIMPHRLGYELLCSCVLRCRCARGSGWQ
jgi:hypothetical protein